MSCGFDQDQLQDYLENEMEPSRRARVEEHVKTCAVCKAQLRMLQWLLAELDAVKNFKAEAPPEIASLREETLNSLFEKASRPLGLKKVLALQKRNFSNAGLFMKFIPGVQTGQAYLRKSAGQVPAATLSFSASLLKGGFKMLQEKILA